MKTKVAIYARYSTEMQDRTSISGQFENCETLASREGLQISAHFSDQATSGNDDSRPEYQHFLERLATGEFDGVICDETSRLTRNQAELHRLVAELAFRDQFLLTCDGIDTRQEGSEILLSIKAAIDAMEGRKTGHRTYRSLRQRHKEGYSAGGKIYGYTSENYENYKRRIVVPDQAEIIVEIFDRYADGESAKKIAGDLNQRGVPSPGSYWNLKIRRAVGWTHTTLLGSATKCSGILRNQIYRGCVTWNKRQNKKVPGSGRRVQRKRPESDWIKFDDARLRVVSDSVWQRVDDRLRAARDRTHPNNKAPRTPGRPSRYMLSGLMTCTSCGGHYVMWNNRAYVCSSQTNGRESLCPQRRALPRSKIESKLLAGIKEQLLAPSVLAEVKKRAKTRLREIIRKKVPVERLRSLQARLRTLDKNINDIADTIIDVGKSNTLTERLAELEKKKAKAQVELARVSDDYSKITVMPLNVGRSWRRIVSDLEHLAQSPEIDRETLDQGRRALHELLGPIRITEDESGVFAYASLSNSVVYKDGAQKRT